MADVLINFAQLNIASELEQNKLTLNTMPY